MFNVDYVFKELFYNSIFLSAGVADAAGELVGFAFEVLLSDAETAQYAGNGGLYVGTHGFDTGVHVDDRRVVFR